jgi:2,4-dienoyl-CoA reductase-like NADH-dependent reductase (Old Yellow Enzyme family)/thioredoxin reductase
VKHLFTPFKIRELVLKNRIVMPALASFLIESDGTITDRTIEHYRRRAAGGAAMIIMEACAVSPEGVVSPHQARIFDDRFLAGMAGIAEAIAGEDSVPALQIHHGGRQTSPRVIGCTPRAPSPLPCPSIGSEVKPLTVAEIRVLVGKFGDAAQRAQQAGFKLIEIHGAHGYLVNQFLSGFSNIREDEYGGSLEGRTRFAREIVEEVRRRLGPDFPLSFKISAQEFVDGGLTTEESIEILKILAAAGVDVIQVSAGNDATPEWICQPMFMKRACLADSAAAVRRALQIPVMPVGRINNPLLAEEIIAEGKADLVCMGRGLVADPQLPNKAREGRLDEILSCIACNTCMQSIFKNGRIECLVNPEFGREDELAMRPAERPRKVMVVGAGPAGIKAAWTAAQRGHEVHLFEKSPCIGGLLIPGSATGHKKEFENLITFGEHQMRKAGVIYHLNVTVTPEIVRQQAPEVVILATGSRPALPDVEGIDNEIVMPFDVLFNTKDLTPADTVVIGGGATGCELAYHLSGNGSRVTVVEVLERPAEQLEAITRKVLLQKLRENDVTILLHTRIVRIARDGVVVADADNREHFLPAGRVAIAIGTRPEKALFEAIGKLGVEVYRVGDCISPRTAKTAILEGARIGLKI